MTFLPHLLHSLTEAIKDSFPASLFSRRLVKKIHAMTKDYQQRLCHLSLKTDQGGDIEKQQNDQTI